MKPDREDWVLVVSVLLVAVLLTLLYTPVGKLLWLAFGW